MKKNTILVIEDDKIIADSVKVLLEAQGYAVISGADGMEGIELAKKKLPSLVVLDLMLPRLNGFDVCQALKNDPLTKKIPIIVLTALGKMGDVEKAFSLGASDYMIKPFDNLGLLQKIKKFIGPE